MSHEAPDDAGALRHLYLIDGSGFVFRAFHALPPLTRPDGTPVNAVLGFTNMLWKILRETDADHAAVIFDTARLTFRNEIYELYKANRGETPEELIPQFPLVREAAGAFNLASIELVGFEADDLIAAYVEAARARGARVTIVSADKDLMQLVEGDSVVMYDYFKNREIGPDQVHERFGVGPERVIDVQALAGDSTDNVPGVPGIGVKTAAQLINDYGDLDRLLERAEEIKQPKRRQNLIEHAEMARLSRDLVTLRRDAPLPMPLEALVRRQPEPGALRAFFQENGFRSIAARLGTDGGEATLAEEEAEPNETAPLPAAYPLVTDAGALADWVEKARESGVLALEPFRAAGCARGRRPHGPRARHGAGGGLLRPPRPRQPRPAGGGTGERATRPRRGAGGPRSGADRPRRAQARPRHQADPAPAIHARANARPGRRCDAGLLGARRQPAWPCSRGPDAAPS